MLQKTQLGWIVASRTYNNVPAKSRTCTLSINQQICQTLNKFWDMEHIADEVLFNAKERNYMEHFTKTTSRDAEGRFVVQMPIKEAKLQQLGKSRSTGLSRFLSLERKLQRQPALKNQCNLWMNIQLKVIWNASMRSKRQKVLRFHVIPYRITPCWKIIVWPLSYAWYLMHRVRAAPAFHWTSISQ